eukprot:2869942-Rhodomonas_salina.1
MNLLSWFWDLTYVSPNWHYADDMMMPGPNGDGPNWDARRRSADHRETVEQDREARLREMDKVMSMNPREKETALSK